jgi:YidC/Oxa1 family membrane protein insertase
MLNILYTIIIYPLVQIIEIFYQVGYKVFDREGLSIICVSIGVTFLCLPLYLAAEKWQNTERETYRRLKPKIDKIKAVFKGDERYMILSSYYRQNNYHPLYSLRNSFGILIQVPFFIAAYTFLSHLESLKGFSFFFIRDLGVPDGLLTIGGIHLNVLPVLMTAINCIAGAIYSRNLYAKDKIQIYGMAALFLVLLYNSPSGLVLYWTMNNIFSLIKNIFMLLKKPLLTLYIILCGLVFSLDILLIFFHTGDLYKRILLVFISLVIPALPLLIKAYSFMANTIMKPLNTDGNKRLRLFIFSQIVCCLLIGLVIPSSVIASSPQEFSFIESVASPFVFLWNTFFQCIGFMIFWPFCLYFLFGDKTKTALTLFSVFLCCWALINTFIFPGSYGEFTGMLNFVNDGTLKPALSIALINTAALLIVCGIIAFLIAKRKLKILLSTFIILSFAFISVSFINSVKIAREYKRLTEIRVARGNETLLDANPVFHLSKEGKNVIVLMLDRGVNSFIPEIFSESPELYSQFSGFTWYPNTLSFNSHTLMGAPPLFGGYEYTPFEINKRSSEALVKKHNESLLLMPLVFSRNGFAVTVTDPPWANYSWIPDIRIYSDYPNIKVENTLRPYTSLWLSRNNFSDLPFKTQILKRNFLWFGFFKSAPLVIRTALYNNGKWWSTDSASIDLNLVLNNYAVLDLLPELTDTNSTEPYTFLLMQNELTHEPAFLQAPDYVPVPKVTDRGASKYADIINYPTNAAALKRLGSWFEYLKEQGLYNNTRIIISADHGADFHSGSFPHSEHIPFRREFFNPLLLVKDFDTDFSLKTNMDFMTNADVPTLAFKDLIPDPLNPFTGNPVNDELKREPLHITNSTKWMPYEHNINTFKIRDHEWYIVHTDIFDADNWQKAEP